MGEPLARRHPAGGSAPASSATRLQGVVLAGSYQWSGSGLESLAPRPLLPVAQSALITYALRWLRDGGLVRAVVCTNTAARDVRDALGDGAHLGLGLSFHEDSTPRGAGGAVRDASTLDAGAETLVIADGSALPAANIGLLLEEHHRQGAALTVAVHTDPGPGLARHPLHPDGIYVMERRALRFVRATGFQDIKENLIPRLHEAGERVVAHVAPRPSPRVISPETYLAVNQWVVARLGQEPEPVESWGAIVSSGGLIAHPTAYVHPSVRIIGPVLLGPETRVFEDATIVGPASLGAGCTVAECALVSRSVAWHGCTVEAEAVVDGCVLADEAAVTARESLFHALKVRNVVRHRLDHRRRSVAHPERVRVGSRVPRLADT